MSRELQGAPLLRCLAVWTVASAASAVVAALALSGSAPAGQSSFGSLLTAGCGLALAGCAAWCWVAATMTIAGAVRGRSWRLPGAPTGLARFVLAACGLVLLVPAAPASAGGEPAPATASALAGLPLPDWPEIPAADLVRVQPGDSLWSIAAERGCAWTELWVANRAVIGADPNLIHPGAVLRLPREDP